MIYLSNFSQCLFSLVSVSGADVASKLIEQVCVCDVQILEIVWHSTC